MRARSHVRGSRASACRMIGSERSIAPRHAALDQTMTSECGETTTRGVTYGVAHADAILLRLDRRGRDVRHGRVELWPRLLRGERLRRGAPATPRLVSVRRVGADHLVLRRRGALDDVGGPAVRAIRPLPH